MADINYADMALSAEMKAALEAARYVQPSPIQAAIIPLALAGKDVLGQARTGTGKTAAFGIPIIEGLEHGPQSRNPQALILTPTRELAVQVRDEIAKLCHGQRINVVAVYGGKPLRTQIEKLKRSPHIVVGTPGRVIDLMTRRALNLEVLRTVVLDEADRMLDIGFRPDIEKILRRCPESRQTLLLSATVPPAIEKLAQRYMRDPEKVDFSPTNISAETIEQRYFTVDQSKKFDLLVELLRREQPQKAIVFCRTKRGTERITQRLSKKTKLVHCIHGDMQQGARNRALTDFKASKYRVLVATDVVGRGIDISDVSHIVNYDIPEFSDDYVHRVGRTGRMGKEGIAFTFVTPEEGNELTRIEMRIDKLLIRDEMPGFAPYERTDVDTGPGPAATIGPAGEKEVGKVVEDPKSEPPKSLSGRGKRYRRAL
ncbi:DEAD/DEAH box helicase [Blastopirellula marina]|uniref:ATP-dependent helicase n=1 Tax=Blastopirellula marina TaxID=124 RepID=A0A2S8FF56_9BACT|nr:DEAD/DEAH box helicase [Blastopirellula marina]PQO30811.1 ATP-dependent helicase [Blastopirellula marina]PTL42664.1 ATP-dependent helicase [Blastopirellula marina]